MVTNIYLIRHAEAEGNAKEFFQGNIDTPLTERGEQQLESLAERFRDIPLAALYFSPYQRTRLTAEAVNRYHDLPMQPEYDLREINGGDWEGRRIADLAAAFPESYGTWLHHMGDFQAPNGDAMLDVYRRMYCIITQIAWNYPGRNVAVVSHGCAIRNFLCYAEFRDIHRLGDVGWADNTAVSLVAFDSGTGKFSLVFKNDSSHLPEALSTMRHAGWLKKENELRAGDSE